jgi:hypothetical protein
MHESRELPIPPAARNDAKAIELARVWAAGGKQHVSLATELWNDPAAWGIMLVDLARHVACTYVHTQGLDADETLSRIRSGFDAEWETTTDLPESM